MARVNILLVDDEEAFVDALTRRLSRRKLDVKSVYNGQDALDALGKDKLLEVVILDVKMPGMDGIETLKQIKTRFPLVEVIMLTGHATVDSGIQSIRQGAFDYLMKPCDFDELLAKVRQAVGEDR